jgi:hypothetical protein
MKTPLPDDGKCFHGRRERTDPPKCVKGRFPFLETCYRHASKETLAILSAIANARTPAAKGAR